MPLRLREFDCVALPTWRSRSTAPANLSISSVDRSSLFWASCRMDEMSSFGCDSVVDRDSGGGALVRKDDVHWLLVSCDDADAELVREEGSRVDMLEIVDAFLYDGCECVASVGVCLYCTP